MRPQKLTTVTDLSGDVTVNERRKGVPGLVVLFFEKPVPQIPHRAEGPVMVGREVATGLLIEEPSVSREHALFEAVENGFIVRDLGSHNGTFVDGERVTEATLVPFGSVVRVARVLLWTAADVIPFEQAKSFSLPGMIGGPALHDVERRIGVVAGSGAPVLLEGETGTGKEVAAQALHAASQRRGAFVGLNCAAIARELVESELFGHARGAFSGSQKTRDGLFRAADGGTLFLDEIGELDLAIQAKLLRVLETGEVRGVGEDAAVRVDVRIVAATNRDLPARVSSGEFRADLFHRIAALRVRMPPLRDRREDIPLLSAHLLAETGIGLSATALEEIMSRPLRGNVRELRNMLLAAASSARYEGRDRIQLDDLEPPEADDAAEGDDERDDAPPSPKDDPRARILAALTENGGNVTKTAMALGVARSGLYETIRRLGIDPSDVRRR